MSAPVWLGDRVVQQKRGGPWGRTARGGSASGNHLGRSERKHDASGSGRRAGVRVRPDHAGSGKPRRSRQWQRAGVVEDAVALPGARLGGGTRDARTLEKLQRDQDRGGRLLPCVRGSRVDGAIELSGTHRSGTRRRAPGRIAPAHEPGFSESAQAVGLRHDPGGIPPRESGASQGPEFGGGQACGGEGRVRDSDRRVQAAARSGGGGVAPGRVGQGTR